MTQTWRPILSLRVEVDTDAFTNEQRSWLEAKLREIRDIQQRWPLSQPIELAYEQSPDQRFFAGSEALFDSGVGRMVTCRYCRFVNVAGTHVGAPVGIRNDTTTGSYQVSDSYAAGAPWTVGLAATNEPLKEDHWGWVLVEGYNIHRVLLSQTQGQTADRGDYIGWFADGAVYELGSRASTGDNYLGVHYTTEAKSAGSYYEPGELLVNAGLV